MNMLTNNGKIKTIKSSEEAVTSNGGNINQDFQINIHNGKGFYETGSTNTFWSTLIITAKILHPQKGIWTITIKDKANKNLLVYENHHMLHDNAISFSYKTGLKVNFLIESTWTNPKDTILSGELSIRY